MVLESIVAIHAKKGGVNQTNIAKLWTCQILENHPIKLIFSGYGFLNRYFDIYFFGPILRRCVKNCQKICWFDMEWPCFEVKVNVYSYEMKYFLLLSVYTK